LSIASGKEGRYILPCLPGLAVAGALNWRAIASRDAAWFRAFEQALGWLLCALGAVAAVALPVAAAWKLSEVLGDACWMAALCVVIAILGWRAARDGGALPALLLAFFVGEASFNVIVLPAPSVEGPRLVVKRLEDALPRGLDMKDLVLFQVPKQGT